MDGEDRFLRDYGGRELRRTAAVASGALVAFALLVLNISLGDRGIGFSRSLGCLLDCIAGVQHPQGSAEWMDCFVIWNTRLPRALGGMVSGAGLAVCGAAMQSMLKNPLVDPFVTGISSGAVLGIAVGMSVGLTLYGTGQYAVLALAFVFALVPMALIVLLSARSRGSVATIILVGIAISSIFGALSTLLMVGMDEASLHSVALWQVGTLTRVTWESLPVMTAPTLLGAAFLVFTSGRLNLLTLGDRSARSMGLDADGYRTASMVVVSLMCACIICFTGIIGFLGLVVPHIIRLTMGGDNRFLVPASAVFGAAFMLACDCVSKGVGFSTVPVGIVLSVIGGPVFFLIILRSRGGMRDAAL